MSDNESTPPIYPEDGTPTAMPDPRAWAEHSDEQKETNLGGIEAAREALRRGATEEQAETDGVSSTDVQESPESPPLDKQD